MEDFDIKEYLEKESFEDKTWPYAILAMIFLSALKKDKDSTELTS